MSRGVARIAMAWVLLAIIVGAGCRGSRAHDAGVSSRSARTLPVDLGVGSGVALVARARGTQIFARDDTPERRSSAEDLVDAVTLLAALRTHVLDEGTVHHCNGLNCRRAHGDVTPARALAVGCLHFFDELAARVGPDALATAFFTVGLEPPAIPVDRDARIRLASRGEGWMLSPVDALRLARGFRDRPAPWSDALDEGLHPDAPQGAGLHGKAAGTGEMTGWFVGYADAGDRPLVVVRVTRCIDACSDSAVAVARWALRQRAPR